MADDPTRVVIVGQGYVGLPLAVTAAEAGHDVVGVDLWAERVDALNQGTSSINDVTDEELGAVVRSGRYRASTDYGVVGEADVVVICVPTPYAKDAPDLSYVESACEGVGKHLRPDTLVILESTTYPGTTEEVLIPILERASGLRAGTDFHTAFSPERIDPGNARFGLRNTPKIVGSVSDAGRQRAEAFYGTFVERVVVVSGPKTAEMAKLLENTFRHINIALVNELAILCNGLGIDVWEVIDAAATKPFGFMPFYPGPGVGGHCIPVDPLYFSWRVRQFGGVARFIELARDINASMPLYSVSRVQDLLNDHGKPMRDANVLVVGLAYKNDISDMRESPALPVVHELRHKGCSVTFHDPYVDEVTLPDGEVLRNVELTDEVLTGSDCVVVLTAHSDIDFKRIADLAPLVFDTRNAVGTDGPNVHRL